MIWGVFQDQVKAKRLRNLFTECSKILVLLYGFFCLQSPCKNVFFPTNHPVSRVITNLYFSTRSDQEIGQMYKFGEKVKSEKKMFIEASKEHDYLFKPINRPDFITLMHDFSTDSIFLN